MTDNLTEKYVIITWDDIQYQNIGTVWRVDAKPALEDNYYRVLDDDAPFDYFRINATKTISKDWYDLLKPRNKAMLQENTE